jgi:hypothetical protein
MKEKRNAYRILVGKAEEKKPLGRPRQMWVDSNKMDAGVIGLIWLRIGASGRALVNKVMNLRVS